MTDSPNVASAARREGCCSEFDEAPGASSEVRSTSTGGDEDFCEDEQAQTSVDDAGEEDDDEWNDFEFAAAPQLPIAEHSQDVVKKSEPTVAGESQVTASSGTSLPAPQPPDAFLSIDTLICDLGQILSTCLNSASSNVAEAGNAAEQLNADGEEVEAGINECSDNHSRLSVLTDLVGESGGDGKGEDVSFSDAMAGEVLALWTSLRLIEEAAALKYQWGESKVYERHLQALRMDLKLAKLRNPKLPAFAWQLSGSALTPEKTAGSGSSNISSSPVVGEHKSAGDDCATPDSAACGPVSSNIHNGSRLGGGSANGAVVAPVQFDWSSSGLRNPLCEGVVDSGSMDLDYFSSGKMTSSPSLDRYDLCDGGSSVVVSAAAADAWKTDLKLLGLMAEDDSTSPRLEEISQSAATIAKSNATSASLLEKLMNSGHRTTSGRLGASSSESALSNEARRLLDTLPDLSFMVSPVLMFPIREDLGRSDGGDDVQL